MSDIKLFRIDEGGVAELQGSSVALEKSLQTQIERHLEALLGVRLLASEYSTGPAHGGRMDTLGIDENGCPVIIEYKRATNENVINQGLFYLDWLMDHRGDFEMAVLNKFGKDEADGVEWAAPRLLCIAGDFSKFDEHAVNQMNRNIELIRYRHYGDDLLLFELINATTAQTANDRSTKTARSESTTYKTFAEYLSDADQETSDLFEAIKAYLLAKGDDVQSKILHFYVAFKRIKNFACIEVRPQRKTVLVYVKVNPDNVDLIDGFTRDVRKIGHYGTGDLEITLTRMEDFERAKPLLDRSYEVS
jgi:predicted transport protein